MFKKPHKIAPKKSKKHFTKHAKKTHKKNVSATSNPMRGGIRL